MQAQKVTSERLDQQRPSANQDPRVFSSCRDELIVHNGVLFKGSIVLIPKLLRPKVKCKFHSSHLGEEAYLHKARDTVFWPGMNAEVRD